MRQRFCYRCGKPVKSGWLCEACAMETGDRPRIRLKEIVQCRVCGKTFHPRKHTFVELAPAEVVKEIYNIPAEEEKGFVVAGGRKIRIRRIMCLECSRKAGGYYEAKVQLRDGLDFLAGFAREDELAKVVRLKEGTDLYFVKKSSAKAFIGLVKDKYAVKFSRKLVGERNGKRLYRDTYAVRRKSS